jgi:cysteine synthase A
LHPQALSRSIVVAVHAHSNLNQPALHTVGLKAGWKVKTMREGILSAVGNTPLVGLTKLYRSLHFRLLGKIEALNPGGSIKDRAALSMLQQGIETGQICPRTVIIESSSGNMGIGLAQACAYWGLRLICVIDAKTTIQNIDILKTFGAEINLVSEPDPATGEFLHARLKRVRELLSEIEHSYWPNQYANDSNSLAHHQTIREILTELNGKLDYLFCATSTCGTLRGCAEYLKEQMIPAKVVAVDAEGSVIFGGQKAARLIPGHGAGVVPPLYQPDLADSFVLVSDLDCVVGCRRLVKQEAILAGGSSGGVLMALNRLKDEIPEGATCVLIFPDRGERYLDTIYNDTWVREHFGEVSQLWERFEERQVCKMVTSF